MARGISRFKYQLWVFALAAFFTGLAGSFYATNARIVGPTILTTPLLLLLMAMMVVGGVGTIWGPLVGSIVLILTDEALKEAGEWRNVGLGLMLAFFAVALPRGLVGLGRRN
jgi:branched-chain amino acid transport system permease protein